MSIKRFLTTLILAMAISVTAASAASARPADAVGASVSDPAAYATTDERSDTGTGASLNAVLGEAATVEPTSSSSSSGFDWGDAGIGAGAAFALMMIGLGGVLVVSSRRHRRQGSPAAV
jgi:hypothetical protein